MHMRILLLFTAVSTRNGTGASKRRRVHMRAGAAVNGNQKEDGLCRPLNTFHFPASSAVPFFLSAVLRSLSSCHALHIR